MDNSVIYTDRHGVKITSSTFSVHKEQYNLEGIQEIKLLKMPSRKMPGIILFALGFILMLLGSLEAFTRTTLGEYVLDANMISIVAGVLLVITAIVAAVFAKSKYALKITTKEGEKRPLESKNKEYVAQVVNALKKAYYRYIRRRERRKY